MKLFPLLHRTPSLKVTLVGAVLTAIGATASLVYFPWAMTSKRNVDTIIAQVNQEIALATSQEVERLFTSAQSAQQLAQSSFTKSFIDLTDQQEQEAFFLSALEANPNFTWIQLGYADGDFVGAQRTPEGLLKFHIRDWNPQSRTTTSTEHSYRIEGNELRFIDSQSMLMNPAFYAPQRPWYQNALKTPGKTAWTIYVYRSTNAPGMDATITLRQKNQTIGVIGIGIELTQLSQYLQRLKGERSGEAFIINAKNELIASTDPQEVTPAQAIDQNQPQLKQFSQTNNLLLQYASQTLQHQQIPLGQIKSWQKYVYTDPQTGNNYFISLTPIGYLDWVVGTVIPEANYLTEINHNKQILFIMISLLVVTTAGLAVIMVDRMIARPILKVAHAAADIEASCFQQDCLVSVTQRTDELGQLARVFQTMAKQVYAREQQLKQQVQELRIEIDEVKRQKQVKEIVESDFFQDLVTKAQHMRKRRQGNEECRVETEG